MSDTIKIAFSPCPNDTFIFDALVHGKIDTEGLKFSYHISDVEDLNKSAFNGAYDVCKMSFHALLYNSERYISLVSGGAYCNNFGPVLIGKNTSSFPDNKNFTVAVPGVYTTAALLYRLFYNTGTLVPFLFSEIEDIVSDDKADMGIIIHENVFTFKQKGLKEIANLGEKWTALHKLPVPLGCIAVRRNMSAPLKKKIDMLIKKSISFAYKNPLSSLEFVKTYANNLSNIIISKHIETYVNNYSLEADVVAKRAVEVLFNEALSKKLINRIITPIFVEK